MENDIGGEFTGAGADGQKRPRYALEELIAQCDPSAPISPELQAWEEMPPVGIEQT